MIKNLIFDFGGVIIDISRENAVKRFQAIGVSNAEELLDKYHQRGIFLEVEDGRITADEFCSELSKIAGREISLEESKEAWLGFFVDIPLYRFTFLEELRRKYKLYILSNTNPFVMSWARSYEFTSLGKPLDDYFDKLYLSYQIGATKPDQRIFDYVITDANINPGETVFIDDGSANIEMANKLGFLTLQPVNGEDWSKKLNDILNDSSATTGF